jgi:dienelactone hydrolase
MTSLAFAAAWLLAAMVLALGALPVSAQHVTRIEFVTFDTNVVPNTTAATPIRLRAELYVPAKAKMPVSAVVITPSSGGVREEVEVYYARELVRVGIAALVIDSFGSRALSQSVHDQSLLNSWQTGNDAVAGLRWLAADPRFRRDRIGVMGLSKGGQVAMDTALTVYLRWMGITDLRFAAHVAVAPYCNWVARSKATTGAPMLLMLAELDAQCPPAHCLEHAAGLRRAGNAMVETKIYEGAHHAWEFLGNAPYFDKWAENFAKCRVWIEDDGSESANDGTRIPRDGGHEWAKKNCMTLGALCCGGNVALKRRATDDAIAFLRKHGF